MSAEALSRSVTRRQFLGWGTGVLAGATLVACGKNADGGNSPGTLDIIHAAATPKLLWSVSYLAEDEGYYKAEGLTVKRTYLAGGPPSATALISGSGDANLSSPGEMLRLVSKGQKLKALMAHTNAEPDIFLISAKLAKQYNVTADSSLEERRNLLAQVKNGRYAITAPGSETDGLTRLALKQVGVDPDTQARLLPLGTDPNSVAALANGRVDGFIAQSPTAEQTISRLGAVPLLLNLKGDIKGGDLLQGQTVEAVASQVDSNPQVFRAMIRAEMRALRSLVEDPDGGRDLLRRTRFGSAPADLWPAMWEHTSPAWKSPYITADQLRAWIDVGLVAGVTNSNGFPFQEVIDMQFVDAAVKDLKWTPPQQQQAH